MRARRWWAVAIFGCLPAACGPPWQPVPDLASGAGDMAADDSVPLDSATPRDLRELRDLERGDEMPLPQDAALDDEAVPGDAAVPLDEAMDGDLATIGDISWPVWGIESRIEDLAGLGSVDLTENTCPGFLPATRWPIGAWYVRSMSVGDVNGDGNPDIVAADGNGLSISILLGDGKGGFQDSIEIPGGDSQVALADFNGDGKLDIAAPYRSSWATAFLGRGDGSFLAPFLMDTPPGPSAIAAGDLDGDGKPDLVVGSWDDYACPALTNLVSVFLGKGDGTFGPRTDLPSVPTPSHIALADFDGNHTLDVAVASFDKDAWVFLGDGKGHFGLPSHIQVDCCSPLGDLEVADMNGDMHPDLIVSDGLGGAVAVVLGKGDGAFFPPREFPAGKDIMGLAVADLNGDGHVDVVTTADDIVHQGPYSVAILHGDGQGNLGPPTPCAVDEYPEGVRAVDLNHDGKLDLVVGHDVSDHIEVFLAR